MPIVDFKQITKVQPMREGEINTVDTVNAILAAFPLATADISNAAITNAKLAADSVTTDKILDGTINTSDLNEGIQEQLSFLASVPAFEFGTSNSFNVSASSYHDCTVTFTAKTKTPIVFCSLQHATGNVTCVLTQVTNTQFNARVFNLTTTDIESVTLSWVAISGR